MQGTTSFLQWYGCVFLAFICSFVALRSRESQIPKIEFNLNLGNFGKLELDSHCGSPPGVNDG